jgi:hypothetical protein
MKVMTSALNARAMGPFLFIGQASRRAAPRQACAPSGGSEYTK